MQVKDYMKGRIKLGSECGSGFIFCGTPNMATEEVLNKVAYERYKAVNEYLRTSKAGVERLKQRITDLEYDIKALSREKKMAFDYAKVIEAKKEQVEHAKEELQNKQKMVDDYQEEVNNFKPIQEREIIETYESVTEKATIVIYKGKEMGKWWSCREYERGYIERS